MSAIISSPSPIASDVVSSSCLPRSLDARPAVHPCAARIEQDRPAGPACYGTVDGSSDCRGQRDKDDLGALARRALNREGAAERGDAILEPA